MIDNSTSGFSGPALRATAPPPHNPDEEGLLTKHQLARRLGLPSARGVEELVRRRSIPVIRLGHRTARFSYADVRTALRKLTVYEANGHDDLTSSHQPRNKLPAADRSSASG